ncbi:MAG: hypothetical protein NC122_10050 [Faecalibacterium sp.]|nr:hypothetical protein [Ruminococcus sp.]MCM1392603.1 hypothetical protein [Ruminococcus sp.]MCM1486532.1 hypothetical protein [Faecalibacterium sp.]
MKNVKITTNTAKKYAISTDLFGIFLEDINFACDGGLNSNKINNYSFDGAYRDMNTKSEVFDYLRYWIVERGQLVSGFENPLSSNSRYGIIKSKNSAIVCNLGYNGLKDNKDKCAVAVKAYEKYVFSAYVRNAGFDGTVTISVVGEDNAEFTKPVTFEVKNTEWEKIELPVTCVNSGYGKLKIELNGVGDLHFDCIVFRNEDVWGKDDPKWKHGKFRKDLIEALADLKPKFMRFPGGCIVEGEFYGNEYNWKETVGELYERKSNYNLWSESLPDGGYNQSYQIGFYEYFCLCEDLNMKPLPTLWAGLNCQYRAQGRKEPCPEITLDDPRFQTEVIDSYLDLIEFANGDPDQNEWAALRKRMGHPEPFGLDRIGVGNENFDEIYFEKFDAIEKAIHEKYPDMKLILSAGGSPDWDRIEPIWAYAKANHPEAILDEHSYNSPEWFIREESRFDNYERGTTKVYMGEYAANGMNEPMKRMYDNGNYFDSAIAEAAFLCGIERNGDVVEMSSYAPLFNLVSSNQWRHNLIDYNPSEMCLTSNYLVQRLFGNTAGSEYIPTVGEKPERVFTSCVTDGNKTYLRVINITDEPLKLSADVERSIDKASHEEIFSPEGVCVKNKINFYGKADYKIKDETNELAVNGNVIEAELRPMSVNVFVF